MTERQQTSAAMPDGSRGDTPDPETAGLELSQFAIDQRALFLSAGADDQVRAVRLVLALLPSEEAHHMLDAMGKLTTQAEVLSEVATGKQQLAAAALAASGARAPAAVVPPPPAPAPSRPPAAVAAALTPPDAIPGLPLTIYYHVQRGEDRDLAFQVASAAAPLQFRPAGVQVVPQGPRDAEVRFYKSAQGPAAAALAKVLAEKVQSLTGQALIFTTRDISAIYPNLPSDRMEVWLAPSMPPAKSP